MFKLKFKKSNVVTETPVIENNSHVNNNVNNYPPEVQMIHKEFFTASEKLLEEANSVLEEARKINVNKVNSLKSLGFIQAREVKELGPLIQKKNLSKELVNLVEYYRLSYPNNKFITEGQVKEICFKYNLVCGDVGRYKGFVPHKNLLDIQKFELKNKDKGVSTSGGTFIPEAEIRTYDNQYYHIYKIGTTNRFKYAFQSQDGINFYSKDSSNIFGLNHLGSVRFKVVNGLKICAPIKDMDMSGLELEDGYKLVKKHIPDPVVLQPVKEGYLILTAWGDEASDPLVVNEINN
jgi:hypothetical protein